LDTNVDPKWEVHCKMCDVRRGIVLEGRMEIKLRLLLLLLLLLSPLLLSLSLLFVVVLPGVGLAFGCCRVVLGKFLIVVVAVSSVVVWSRRACFCCFVVCFVYVWHVVLFFAKAKVKATLTTITAITATRGGGGQEGAAAIAYATHRPPATVHDIHGHQ
jgi:hypothetical protein